MLLAGRGSRISTKYTSQPDSYLPGRFRCLNTRVADQSARLTHHTDHHSTGPALAGGGALAPSLPDQGAQSGSGALLELDDDGGQPRFPGVNAMARAPDPNLAVGPNHIVQIVNDEFAIYSKSGSIFAGYPRPSALSSALLRRLRGQLRRPHRAVRQAADRWLIASWEASPLPTPSASPFPKPTIPPAVYNLYSTASAAI